MLRQGRGAAAEGFAAGDLGGEEQGEQPRSRDQALDVSTPPPRFSLRRLWPVLVLISGLLLFLAFDGPKYFALESLSLYRADLTDYVTYHAPITVIIFDIGYSTSRKFSIDKYLDSMSKNMHSSASNKTYNNK